MFKLTQLLGLDHPSPPDTLAGKHAVGQHLTDSTRADTELLCSVGDLHYGHIQILPISEVLCNNVEMAADETKTTKSHHGHNPGAIPPAIGSAIPVM